MCSCLVASGSALRNLRGRRGSARRYRRGALLCRDADYRRRARRGGLGLLRKDAILWPVMLASLLVALWGFWRGFRPHANVGPLLLGIAGAVSLASGVIVVHGFRAMHMIYGGAITLLVATFWNVWARRV